MFVSPWLGENAINVRNGATKIYFECVGLNLTNNVQIKKTSQDGHRCTHQSFPKMSHGPAPHSGSRPAEVMTPWMFRRAIPYYQYDNFTKEQQLFRC
jgi:hypothetical protein